MPQNADRRVGVFIAKADRWQSELAALRTILLDMPLVETLKWRQPVYMWEGSNIAILWAFKENCGLGFFKGALIPDPKGLLVAPGKNSRLARKIPFRSVAEIVAQEPAIRDYVTAAVDIEKAGLKVELPDDDLSWPVELEDALSTDAGLRKAFNALTPGRRRSWILHIGQAKQSATRSTRIARAAPKIREGKGMNDR